LGVGPLEQGVQIGIRYLLERCGKFAAQITAQPLSARQADRHQVLCENCASVLSRGGDEHVGSCVERRRPIEQPPKKQVQPDEPATSWEDGLDQAAPELLGVNYEGIERFCNLKL
jgi:hypothetical protein